MKRHLLVIDDERPIRHLLSCFFREHEFEVTTSATSLEAQRVVNEVPIDLVILDINLPDVDGLDLLATLKSSHPNLPVIMLTGLGYDDELVQESLRRGAAGFISKSLPLDQLLMEVHRTFMQPPPV